MNLRKWPKRLCIILAVVIVVFSASCSYQRRPQPTPKSSPAKPKPAPSTQQKPTLPKTLNAKPGIEPRLKVYITDEKKVREMPFEEYVAGVVAGEIKSDWPEEAIKAQAIIARTFVLDFISTKGHSKYKNAHISTDIEEAQAWSSKDVNEKIRKAVKDTRGRVIVYNGKYAKTWFHSNAGGITATAKEGLNYKWDNPPYIKVVKSPDTGPEVPAGERKWTAVFPKSKIIDAAGKSGKTVKDFSKISIGKKGPSGRAMTILLDNTEVSAPELRIALGSMKMKSTLLDSISISDDNVQIKGRGYGHGVGMSQWGAYSMAKQGKKAQDIISYYFKGVKLADLWK